MPINEAHRRCPDAVYLRPRMAHYLEVAHQIRAVMATCTPVVEAISIDEAFLDISGLGHLVGPPETIGAQIKTAIRAAVGLTASVGIAPNRLVAKIASDFGKPDGLVVVPSERVLDFLGGQPVGVLRGVGSRILPILKRPGLRTVADLRGLSVTQLQANLGPRAAINLTVKVAPGARSTSPSPIGGGPGRGTAKAPATFIFRGGAGAMAVTSRRGASPPTGSASAPPASHSPKRPPSAST